MILRRSSRLGHADDRERAPAGIGNPSSSSTVQSTSTTKKTTFANMKTSKKKTPSRSATSSSLKRKGQPEKVGAKSKKKPRMDEELTQEESLALSQEVSQLLQPLQDQLDHIIKAFPQYQQEPWYKTLETRRELLPALSTRVKSRDELLTRPELNPFIRIGLPFTSPGGDWAESELQLVQVKLDDLDTCLKKAIDQSQEPPAPSTYCLGAPYRRSQLNPRMGVRDGRTGTAPVALELLHISFRTFTYWSFLSPYPLPGSPAHSKETRSIDKDAFINVYQAANQLLLSMPQLYTSHDDRLDDFKKALLLIFPENDNYEWCQNMPADQGLSEGLPVKYRIDIVYRHKRNRVPLIFIEVKLELGEGGNPFWQNHRLYQSYTKENLKSRRNGAPVFLIQLCGTHLGIGGGFCDALDDNQSPIVLQLGGYVNLQYDYVGRNLRETVNTLWALHEAIKQIPLRWDDVESRHKLLDIPRYGSHSVVEITDVLHPGVVYLGKYIGGSQNEVTNFEVDEKLVLKVIYSGMVFEPYGAKVHKHLELKDMAPKYFFSFNMNGGGLPPNAEDIEDHHLMEYLPPPSNDSTGWISLLDLEEKFPLVASFHKVDIKAALDKIVDALGDAKYVHGDLRPNNLLISIKVTTDGCIIQNRPDSAPPIPYLKVIDFDWAGDAGIVEYPPHRNPDVEWPGNSGKPILATHDKIMIESWLSKWPHVSVPDAEEGDRRGDEVTFLRISHKSM